MSRFEPGAVCHGQCQRLLAGLVAAGAVVGASLSAVAFGLASAASAQEPPPEVYNCARLPADRAVSGLVPAGFAVTLDAAARTARLAIPQLPASATCYAVFRSPSDTNPIASAWDAVHVDAPAQITDPSGFTSADRYCYQLVVGNRSGWSRSADQCVDVPDSVAPAPTPTPTLAATPPAPGTRSEQPSPTPRPPESGNGGGSPAGDGAETGAAVLMGLAALLGGAALLMSRKRR